MSRISTAVNIDTGLHPKTRRARVSASAEPFRIVLLGDFGGRASRREPRLLRDPILVDPDNFEQVMERLGAGLELSAGGGSVQLQFRELDDFHPDHLYRTLPLFEPLRKARAELANPANFRQAAANPQVAPPPLPPPEAAFSGSLLDQIVEQSAGPVAAPLDPAAPLDEAIRRIVAPHLVPKSDPRQRDLVAQVDSAAGALLRAILSHPQFQALEAAWRSVFFLLQRLHTGVELKLYLIDITREEMLEATRSGHPQMIVREPWSAAACLHGFAPTEQDCATLETLAALARKAGGPILAGIDPRVAGCPSIAETPDPDDWRTPLDEAGRLAWRKLRQHPDAAWIGLALPRILLRLPYGRETSAAESFDFEEMARPPAHDAYLWGSPAVACVCLLGQGLRPGARSVLDSLPVHNYRLGGEPRMTPAAETWITDREAEKIAAQGVMPIASSRSTDSILVVNWQSVADPPRALAGNW